MNIKINKHKSVYKFMDRVSNQNCMVTKVNDFCENLFPYLDLEALQKWHQSSKTLDKACSLKFVQYFHQQIKLA